MLLHNLINNLSVIQIAGSPELVEIDNLTIDSRSAVKGSMFFAIKGFKADGHSYIAQAVSNGVSAVILDNDSDDLDNLLKVNDVVKVVVKDTRKSLPIISDVFYGSPSSKLNLIGITGTKGKTTTSYYIKSILENAGKKSGLIGTNKNMIGPEEIKTRLTTPESHVINDLLNKMVIAECSDCVMEVSSHSAELSRVEKLNFNVGVFTNITSDHLDFHISFKNYLAAKKKFIDSLHSESTLIYNQDDENYSEIIKDCSASKVSYSAKSEADLKIENVEYDLNGTSYQLVYDDKEYKVDTKLIGLFNAYNSTAAIGAAIGSGISIEKAIEGIKVTPQVPGRFEVISKGEKKVIVDYSHTADSLEQALEAIKYMVKDQRKIYTVFGCGGDRDKTKRPKMGNIAEDSSDFCILTSDNPRSENPYQILKDIEQGMKGQKSYRIIEDREEAIKTAIESSEENAVILIAGKGHEAYQEINGIRNYFSDKETALKYLNI